ncbi:hypothetical protein MSG28_010676 [Choristoneura fumiferana]|uniref:Uncharacterized protein n=1 Tax=Choristoneura fumiferana TaxID=7141 RepID=A0ACC0KP24_CHOFU|nr:hypothetical protein MSG28_010676 [Choristoneura fumiferana]
MEQLHNRAEKLGERSKTPAADTPGHVSVQLGARIGPARHLSQHATHLQTLACGKTLIVWCGVTVEEGKSCHILAAVGK